MTPVGVFVNQPADDDQRASPGCVGLGVVQLHGDETPRRCARLMSRPVLKAVERWHGDAGDATVAAPT